MLLFDKGPPSGVANTGEQVAEIGRLLAIERGPIQGVSIPTARHVRVIVVWTMLCVLRNLSVQFRTLRGEK